MKVIRLIKTLGILAAALALCDFSLGASVVAAGESGDAKKIVAGYYAAWAAYSGYTPADIPARRLTHVLYAFANLDDSHRITLGDSQVDLKNFAQLRALKEKNPALKTLISIGGWEWSGKFSGMAATAQGRETFAKSVAAFLREHGFDGADIDWEYPVSGGKPQNGYRAADKENFTLLLETLRQELNAQGEQDGKRYLLTMAGGAGREFVGNVQMKSIARYLDFGLIMAYDIHGFGDKYTDHNAPLYDPAGPSPQYIWSADQGVAAWSEAGFPKDKIVLGVPFYGRSYTNVKGGGTGFLKPYGSCKSIGYDTIVSKYLSNPSFTRYLDEQGRTPWLFDGSTFISYEDEASLKEKAAYILQQNLAGAGIWELSHSKDGKLLQALNEGLQ